MLTFSGSLKVFVSVEPCDMRRSFNGLHDLVANKLREDPKNGAIFAFTNKRRNRVSLCILPIESQVALVFFRSAKPQNFVDGVRSPPAHLS